MARGLSTIIRVFTHTNLTPAPSSGQEQGRLQGYTAAKMIFSKHKSDDVNYTSSPSSNFYNFQVSWNKIQSP